MYISGSIGITILRNLKNNKRIILFADDHSKKVYCDDKTLDQHYEIKEFLEKELENGQQILLEEVPREDFNLEELWPESPHTQDLKNFFLNEPRVTGIDIRPFLIPFSWNILDDNQDENIKNILITEYLKLLDSFFNLKGNFFNEKIYPSIKKIKIKNSGLGKNLNDINQKYIKMKKTIDPTKTIIYYFENDTGLFNKIDEICDNIMEFYTLLNVFTNNRISIIHAGLFHSNNILNWLTTDYNFEIIYQQGTNTYPTKKDYKSCVHINIKTKS